LGNISLPIVIIIMVLLAGIYGTYSKRNKVFCFYEGEDGTKEFKWMTDKDGWVIFRGHKHKIMPERMTTWWVKTGIHMLFPTRVQFLSYTWESAWPRDPKNHNRTVIDPRVRKIIDQSSMMESYFKTSSPTASKKQGLLEKYGVMIAIVIIVIIGVFVWQNTQSNVRNFETMQNQINSLKPK